MGWQRLSPGAFSGIDWADPRAAAGHDPYLAWAENDGFAGYGGQAPRWLPVVIALQPGAGIADLCARASASWLHVPPVYRSAAAPPGLRHCTARVRRGFFEAVAPGGPLADVVARFEMGLPAEAHADDPNPPGTAPTQASLRCGLPHPVRAGERLRGPVMGLIDGGLALAHAHFMQGPRARVRWFWRQDRDGVGRTPAGLGYGHELSGRDIEQACARFTRRGMVDEDALYAHWRMPALRRLVGHGTHVLDLAVAPNRPMDLPDGGGRPWRDAAAVCDIAAVQLDFDTVRDTSGGSMNLHILDALMYLLSRCADGARLSVCLSWGTLAGPHNGSAVLEAAMDDLIACCGGRLTLAVAASNSYQARTHANLTLDAAAPAHTLHWRLPPDDRSQSFLELWVPPGSEGLRVSLTPPAGPALPPLALGQSRVWRDDTGRAVAAVIGLRRVALGQPGTCVLVAVGANAGWPAAGLAPPGTWQVGLQHSGASPIVLDAYVERDDEILGYRTGRRQGWLVDPHYDLSATVDQPHNPSLVRRSGSFNSIATGARVASVGGVRLRDGSWSRYSPRRPDPDAARPERPVQPAVVKMPATEAPTDLDAAVPGRVAASNRSGGVVRLAGTSDATPQVARRWLDGEAVPVNG